MKGEMTGSEAGLTIREARREDVPVIVRLLANDSLGRTREAMEIDGNVAVEPAYMLAFDTIDADPSNRLIVAEIDGEVAGCMQITLIPGMTFKGGRRMQIEGVRVKDGFRGRQIGSGMIDWAIRSARALDCHMVQLTSNKLRVDAQRFYERHGFEPSHVGYKRILE